MIDTPSIPPVNPSSSAQKDISLDQQTILKIPKSLNLLKAGDVVDAVVLRKENANSSIIKITSNNIEDGELPVVGKAILKKGSVLKLEILPSPDKGQGSKLENQFNFQARIQSIDGKVIDNKNSLNSFDIIKSVIPENIKPQQNAAIRGDSISGGSSSGTNNVGGNNISRGDGSLQASAIKNESSIVNLSKGAFFTGSILNPSKGNESYLPKVSDAGGVLSGSVKSLNSSDQVTFHIVSVSNKSNPVKDSNIGSNLSGNNFKSDIVAKNNGQDSVSLSKANLTTNNQATNNSLSSEKNVNLSKGIDAYNKQVSPNAASGNNPVSSSDALKSFASRSQFLPSAGINLASTTNSAVTTNKQFSASILGVDKSGETILSTPLGTVKLASAIKIPSSSDLILEVVKHNSLVNKPGGLTIDDEPTKLITSLSEIKNAFGGFLDDLDNIGRDVNINLSDRIFPKTPSSELGAKLFLTKSLWFMSNIFNVSPNTWIGDKVADLLKEKGKAESLQRLDKAFSQLKILLSEQNYSGWNNFIIPVYDGEKLNYMNFYTRRNKKGKNNNEENIRFLVEVTLDNMGEIQLDGIVTNRTLENSSREIGLDLVIKSHNEFSDEVKNGIIDIYNNLARINNIDVNYDDNQKENKWGLRFVIESDFRVKPYSDGNENSGSITI